MSEARRLLCIESSFDLEEQIYAFADALREKYHLSKLELFLWGTPNILSEPNVMGLANIEVPENSRGQGIGAQVMKEICQFADKHNLAIELEPEFSERDRLVRFYSQFGFRPAGMSSMVRPRQMGEASQLQSVLMSLRPQMASAAQAIYDEWAQDEDGLDAEFGGGGICDEVAREIHGILAGAGIDTVDGGADGDDHAWVIAYDDGEAYGVDIPPGVYEEGGGYAWTKIPDVMITPDDVEIWPIERSWIGEAVVPRNQHVNPDGHEAVENDIDPARMDIYNRLRAKFGDPIGSGQGRVVFDTGHGYVIKLGLDSQGDTQNTTEARKSRGPDNSHGRLAKCRLYDAGGYPLLVMEYLTDRAFSRTKYDSNLIDLFADQDQVPDWASEFDHHQLGRSRDGRVKAYDFGDFGIE